MPFLKKFDEIEEKIVDIVNFLLAQCAGFRLRKIGRHVSVCWMSTWHKGGHVDFMQEN